MVRRRASARVVPCQPPGSRGGGRIPGQERHLRRETGARGACRVTWRCRNDERLTDLTKLRSVSSVANDVLRRALSEARLTERQLAQRVGVDPATVSRWVADEHRTPQARLRCGCGWPSSWDVTKWTSGRLPCGRR